MKVFFSSELMVWLSLTLGAGAASLVPCGKIRTGVAQSYTSCTFLIRPGQAGPWGGVEWPAALPHGAVLSLCFPNNNTNIVLLIWESHLQNFCFGYSDFQMKFRHSRFRWLEFY